MSSVYPLQSSFTNGEISPLLASRVDIDFWRTSLAYCRNFQILSHGGIRRRSGSRFIAEVRSSAELARLLPFRFSEAQSYVLSLNNGFSRFLSLRGVVGSPYEIAQPWSADSLRRLSYAQFNDVVYFANRAYSPRRLQRAADTDWSLAEAGFKSGPYLEEKTLGTALVPSGRGSITPAMTSNTAPSGTVSSSPSDANAYKVFDLSKTSSWVVAAPAGEVSYAFASGTKVCDAYWVSSAPNYAEDTPVSWVVQGYDGTNWVTLDTRDAENGWQQSETRYFEFENKTAYQAYKFKWSAVGQADSDDSRIGEIGFNEGGDTPSAFTLTATATSGLNGGTGFLSSDVGRSLRLMGSDGRWRTATIIARGSSTSADVRMVGHALPDTSPISRWQIGAFSTYSGFPAAVSLYDERVVWARTDTEPVTVYGSRQGVFDEYGVSDPPVPTDGLKITLLSSNMNEILWLTDDEDLVTGSAGQIRSIGPSDITQAFSATNITQKKGPTSGAAYLQPISVGGVTLYVGAGGTKIRELILGDQNRYVAPELTVLAEHMFKAGIVDWAFSEKPDPTIYAATGDGLLVAITYDREQKVLGFARHDFGGAVESLAVIPGLTAGADDLYMVVRRTINGATKRYIEVMEAPFDGESADIEDAYFVDCGLTYSGSPISTVTGLGHLEGQSVKVFADGQYIGGDFTVSGGSITLPSSFSKISVGLGFKSRAITLPIAGPGQDGYLFGRRAKAVSAHVDVLNSGSLKVGAYGDENWTPPLYEQILQEGGGLFSAPTSLTTGFVRCDFDSSWAQGQGKIVMETDDPLPLLIRAVMLQSEYEP